MKLRGEDVASAVRDWIKDEIRKAPSARHELGKFFLGVSTGTLGLYATLLKFAAAEPTLDGMTSACFAALLLSALVGLYMAVPHTINITEDTELYSTYNRIVRTTIGLMGLWVTTWLAGFVLGTLRLFD
ncbi:MAG: hypothetical protein GX576_08635 [Thauera phenolivorans]|uniref:Uncharacterized protein n=1 Tax=Thauera phenolivorans TaxID=1792543 RepID=A0A7X7LW98_9RHOO|nr:hypothetical protein [Thauera phenolivorans]